MGRGKNNYIIRLKQWAKSNKNFLLFFITSMTVGLTWLAAFYPAFMSFDSIYTWNQTITLKFDAATGHLYTFLMLVLRQIWDNPAILSILQVTTSSLIMAYFLNYFLKKGVKKKIILPLFGLLLILPVVNVYNLTLWKDILFAQGITLASLLWVKTLIEKKSLLDNRWHSFLLALLIVSTGVIRLNGLIYIFVFPLAFLLYSNLKNRLTFIGFVAVLYLLIAIVLPKAMKVDNTRMIYFSEATKIQILAGILKYDPQLFKDEEEVINKIMPVSEFKKRYTCPGIDGLYLNNSPYNEKVFYEEPGYKEQFEKMFNRIALRNLPYAMADRTCLFVNTLGLTEYKNTYMYQMNIIPNKLGIEQSGNPFLQQKLNEYLEWSKTSPQKLLIWTQFTYLTIFLIYLAVAIWQKNYPLLGFISLILINVPVLFVFGVSRDFRYLYMLPYSLIFLPLIYSATKQNKTWEEDLKQFMEKLTSKSFSKFKAKTRIQ